MSDCGLRSPAPPPTGPTSTPLSAGRGHGEGHQEARRLALDDVQEALVREHRVAAVVGRAEPVVLDPPALRRPDGPLWVRRMELAPFTVRIPEDERSDPGAPMRPDDAGQPTPGEGGLDLLALEPPPSWPEDRLAGHQCPPHLLARCARGAGVRRLKAAHSSDVVGLPAPELRAVGARDVGVEDAQAPKPRGRLPGLPAGMRHASVAVIADDEHRGSRSDALNGAHRVGELAAVHG